MRVVRLGAIEGEPGSGSGRLTVNDSGSWAVPLVSRVGRGLQLTPPGEVFARYARQLLGLLKAAAAIATGEIHTERGRARLAAVTAGEHVLPRFLAGFRDKYPGG